jgi:hypothetical protein
MLGHQRGSGGTGSTHLVGFTHLVALLALGLALVLAAACGSGHSSPVEPKGDTLTVLSVSPPEGTAFAPGSPFHVHVVLQYHLADGPVANMHFDELRADGSPLYQVSTPVGPIQLPNFDFPIPLIHTDGTFPFDIQGVLPQGDIGPEVLLRFILHPKGGSAATAEVTLHYPIVH